MLAKTITSSPLINVNGVVCGLMICYDNRFPELYRQYSKLGVQVMFHSFYNARMKADSILPKIILQTAQVHAATNFMFVSMSNACAPHSWESRFVTPDGMLERALVADEPGVMVSLVDTAKNDYDASRPFRADAIDGKWHSGETVSDPRSTNRKSY